MSLKVSDVARQAGVTSDAIRFYEREGLLPAPPRSLSGYREYGDSTPLRVRFIKGAQAMGLKLAEIKELLEIQDKGACPCGHTCDIIERRLGEIDSEIARLTELRKDLQAMADLDCPATTEGDLWPCEATFIKRGGESIG